jgi:hypothetical protein
MVTCAISGRRLQTSQIRESGIPFSHGKSHMNPTHATIVRGSTNLLTTPNAEKKLLEQANSSSDNHLSTRPAMAFL